MTRLRTSLLHRVEATIRTHALFQRGQRVLVAVSGGPDSVALLDALWRLSRKYRLSLIAAHLNHSIRGASAAEDARFVRRLARQLDVPCVVGRRNVPRLARQQGLSLEMAAREARYAFLIGIAAEANADAIATAHTADDQAETLFLRLARGAGAQGLSGIPYAICRQGIRIVRPLLDVRREDVLKYLRSRRRQWREDESNADMAFLRNRVRHEILPLLERRLNPRIRSALVRTADLLREENRWMDALAETLLIRCRAPEGGTAGNDAGVLLCRRLRKEPLAARRRALRLWLQRRGVPAAALDFGAVDRIERLLERPRGSGVVPLAGGWTVRRSYDRLAAEHRARARRSRFRAAVRIPGETVVAGPGLRVTAAFSPGVRREKPAGPGQLPAGASLSAARIGRHALYVRSWRTGDRMKPLGLGGHKKLQDIFVDEKVPADRRSQVPIFECRRQIVWLPGYRVADGWEVRPGDELALQLAVARV